MYGEPLKIKDGGSIRQHEFAKKYKLSSKRKSPKRMKILRDIRIEEVAQHILGFGVLVNKTTILFFTTIVTTSSC